MRESSEKMFPQEIEVGVFPSHIICSACKCCQNSVRGVTRTENTALFNQAIKHDDINFPEVERCLDVFAPLRLHVLNLLCCPSALPRLYFTPCLSGNPTLFFLTLGGGTRLRNWCLLLLRLCNIHLFQLLLHLLLLFRHLMLNRCFGDFLLWRAVVSLEFVDDSLELGPCPVVDVSAIILRVILIVFCLPFLESMY